MPISAKYVREHPDKEYVLDKPGHHLHGAVGVVWLYSENETINGIDIRDPKSGAMYFIPCGSDNITVKGNLGVVDPNNGNVADEGETYWVGKDIRDAAFHDRMFVSDSEAKEHIEYWSWQGWKIFKVKTAFFFDSAEEVN